MQYSHGLCRAIGSWIFLKAPSFGSFWSLAPLCVFAFSFHSTGRSLMPLVRSPLTFCCLFLLVPLVPLVRTFCPFSLSLSFFLSTLLKTERTVLLMWVCAISRFAGKRPEPCARLDSFPFLCTEFRLHFQPACCLTSLSPSLSLCFSAFDYRVVPWLPSRLALSSDCPQQSFSFSRSLSISSKRTKTFLPAINEPTKTELVVTYGHCKNPLAI